MHRLAATPVMDLESTVGLGDTVTFTRLPELYHAEFGHPLQVAAHPRYAYVFDGNPYAAVVPLSVLAEHPESVFNPWGGYQHEWQFVGMNPTYHHTVFHFPQVTPDLKPRLFVEPRRLTSAPTVLFCSGGSKRALLNRPHEIPPAFLEPLIGHLVARGVRVANVGGLDNYRPSGRYLDLAGTPAMEVAALLAGGPCAFLCVNSGLMHVANAVLPPGRILVYVDADVPNPLPFERFKTDLPNHDWLYGDNVHLGTREGLENVLALDATVARLEALCTSSP